MPAIISIILIRLDQFIIAGPRATSHLNEFNWRGEKTAQITAWTCRRASQRDQWASLEMLPPSLQNILEHFSAEGNQSDYKPCVRAQIVVGACVQSFWSIKHRITISLTAKNNCSKLYNKENWNFNSKSDWAGENDFCIHRLPVYYPQIELLIIEESTIVSSTETCRWLDAREFFDKTGSNKEWQKMKYLWILLHDIMWRNFLVKNLK